MAVHKPFTLEKARYRPARIAGRIKEELMLLVPGSLRDPIFKGVTSITITSVDMSPNMKDAAIGFSMYDSGAKTVTPKLRKEYEAAFNKAAGYLRSELHLSLNMKITPHLVFKYDKGYENTRQINDLLRTISASEPQTSATAEE